MRVEVDEPRHDHESAAADLALGRARIGAADVDELVALEGDVAARIGVGVRGAVERDDPVGVPDHGGHGELRSGAIAQRAFQVAFAITALMVAAEVTRRSYSAGRSSPPMKTCS